MRFVLFALFLCLVTYGTYAQSPNRDAPLEITADETLEWLRGEQRFVARGNALAVQGGSSVVAQVLTADYADTPENGMQISIVTAEGRVVITSDSSQAYGDRAVYNLAAGQAVITGSNLRMVSPDQAVTARDRFEYFVEAGRLNAVGNAVVIRPNPKGGQDRIRADVLSAVFGNNAAGERVLQTMEAKGNVVITTPTEQARGDYGIYRASSNKAELRGGVEITRGPNILKGERAEVDLTTNVSTIFAADGTRTGSGSGRVRGVFFPGSEERTP